MLRALPAVLLVVFVACGGGDDAPTDEEIRRSAARACTQHSQALLLDQDLPPTPPQARRLRAHVLDLEDALLRRLERIDRRDLLKAAIAARRDALAARRAGRPDAAADRRAAQAFRSVRVRPCAGFGAAAVPGGPVWTGRTGRLCARFAGRAHALRRSARGPEAHAAVGRLLARVNDQVLTIPAAPNEVDILASEAEHEMSRAELPLMSLGEALLRGARSEARALRRQLRRAEIRGRAAWQLLDVPACDRLLDAVS